MHFLVEINSDSLLSNTTICLCSAAIFLFHARLYNLSEAHEGYFSSIAHLFNVLNQSQNEQHHLPLNLNSTWKKQFSRLEYRNENYYQLDFMNILLASSNTQLVRQLDTQLSNTEHTLFNSADGQDALFIAATQNIDIVIADSHLASIDQEQLLNYAKDTFSIKTVMITDQLEQDHIVISSDLDIGQQIQQIMHLSCDTPVLTSVTIEKLTLTKTEKKLIAYLFELKGNVVAKQELQLHALRKPLNQLNQTIDMHMCNIRRKLFEAGYGENVIKTVHNQGYCIS